MKLPDNEPLEAEDYWTVTDTWKQEWERGVQVKIRSNEAVQCAMCNVKIRSNKTRLCIVQCA